MPIRLAIVAWGDRWQSPDGPPTVFTTCGHDLTATVVCTACGGPFDVQSTSFRPGPGATSDTRPAKLADAAGRRAHGTVRRSRCSGIRPDSVEVDTYSLDI